MNSIIVEVLRAQLSGLQIESTVSGVRCLDFILRPR